MSTTIVIDDERTFRTDEDVVYYRNVAEFCDALVCTVADEYWAPEGAEIEGTFEIEAIWWDHDLGDGQDVMDCVKVMHMFEDLGLTNFATIPMYVHSQNPVGAQNIVDRLSQFCQDVTRVPLPELQGDLPAETEV